MKITAHILLEVDVDTGVPHEDIARAVAAGAERAARDVVGDGFRTTTYSVATSPMSRAALDAALHLALGDPPR